MLSKSHYIQSWLQDEIFRDKRIPIPGIDIDKKISKISKSRRSGSGFKSTEKIPRKSQKNPESKSRGYGIFFSLRIFSPGIRDFFNLGIFIPGIRDFLVSGFFNLEIIIPGIRDFLISGFLSPGFGIFFV